MTSDENENLNSCLINQIQSVNDETSPIKSPKLDNTRDAAEGDLNDRYAWLGVR